MIWSAGAVILILLVLFGSLLQKFFSPAAHTVLDPIFKVSQNLLLKSKNLLSFLKPKSILIAENENLKTELLIKGTTLLDYEIIKRENEILKSLTNGEATSTRVIAAVLKTPDQSPYDTILIDKGAEAGINEGDLVYAEPSIPIGLIEYLYKNSSLVKLYSTPGESYDVYLGVQKISGKAVGRGGGNFEVILPHGSKVVEGDTVTLPGIMTEVFGLVESVMETQGGTFIRVLFKNPYSFDDLRLVKVLI